MRRSVAGGAANRSCSDCHGILSWLGDEAEIRPINEVHQHLVAFPDRCVLPGYRLPALHVPGKDLVYRHRVFSSRLGSRGPRLAPRARKTLPSGHRIC